MLLSAVAVQHTSATHLETLVRSKDPGLPRYVFGGLTFGLGWGLAGVCPGPIFTLLGSGVWVMLIVLFFALIGTWLYGVLRDHLPH